MQKVRKVLKFIQIVRLQTQYLNLLHLVVKYKQYFWMDKQMSNTLSTKDIQVLTFKFTDWLLLNYNKQIGNFEW